MPSEPFAQGRCLCGAVSYTINAKPIRMAQCHCKDCQRASGTGHMSLAFFKADDVTLRGTTSKYGVTADSGNRELSINAAAGAGDIDFRSDKPLAPGDQLSIAVALRKGTLILVESV